MGLYNFKCNAQLYTYKYVELCFYLYSTIFKDLLTKVISYLYAILSFLSRIKTLNIDKQFKVGLFYVHSLSLLKLVIQNLTIVTPTINKILNRNQCRLRRNNVFRSAFDSAQIKPFKYYILKNIFMKLTLTL